MLSTALFIALLTFDFGLILVVFLARNHQMYADVFAAVAATILSWYLSLSALNDNVGDVATVANQTVENVTSGVTTVSYTTVTTPFIDPGLSLLLAGVAAVMTIVTFGLVLGVGLEIFEKE